MIVISDASPLHYLILIGAEGVLPQLFGDVLIPPAVHAELQQARTPQAVRDLIAAAPSWLRVVAPATIDPLLDVDRGEAEAISLAVEFRADALLIDDKKGRRAAKIRGVTTIGTLTVLETAAQQGWIALADAFDRLRQTNFRAMESMLQAALDRDAQRRLERPSPEPEQAESDTGQP